MRVAHVNLQRDWGGAEKHVALLSKGLQEAGAGVVVCCHPHGGLVRAAEASGLSTRTVKTANQLDVSAAFKLASQLARFKPDVLHLHTPKDYLAGTLAARLLGRPAVVLTRHMLLPLKPMMRRVYSRSNAILCLADSIRNALLEQGIAPGLLHHVPTGIEVDQFDTPRSRNERQTLRQQWGTAPNEIVFGCVGRLVEGKGHEFLLRAFHRVVCDLPASEQPLQKVRLVFIGDGPLRPILEALTSQLGIAPQVHLAGFHDDIPSALSALDALVLPSFNELLPLSVLEGMASGLPVIATRVGGIPEAISSGESGWLIEHGDLIGLSQAVCSLARNADMRKSLGASGQLHVRQNFTAKIMCANTLMVYQSVVEIQERSKASRRLRSAP